MLPGPPRQEKLTGSANLVIKLSFPPADPRCPQLTQRFAERYSKRIRFVYVSIDETENGFHSATKDKPWTSMESVRAHRFHCTVLTRVLYQVERRQQVRRFAIQHCVIDADSFSLSPSESDRSDLSLPQPSEPFLLATEPDLEATFHLTDPTGSLYLRPYSRVFLAEKFQVFGVPQLVIYNIEKQEVLTKHARFSKLQMTDDGQEAEKTISDWEQGVSSSFTLSDLIYAVRWSLGLSVLAVSYLLAVHVGGMDDVMSKLSSQFTKSYLGIE